MNLKHKDQGQFVMNLNLNLIVYLAKICKQCVHLFLIQQKSLYVIGICCNLQNNGRQKQVKSTEVSSYGFFEKTINELLVINAEMKL